MSTPPNGPAPGGQGPGWPPPGGGRQHGPPQGGPTQYGPPQGPPRGGPFPGPGYQPGPPYPGPPRGNTGLVIGLVAAVVLVLAVVAAFVLFQPVSAPSAPPPPPTDTARPSAGPDTTEPPLTPDQLAQAREHAERFVAAINARDEAAAVALTCEKQRPGGVYLTAVEHAPVSLAAEPRLVDVERAVFNVEVERGRLFAIEVVGPDPWCVHT